MSRSTLTVAIPSYNKAPYIRRCLDSVLKNASDIDQIILIDNCSSDETFTIAQEYEPHVTCVRNEENVGMTGNFNRCIELCETDWLMIFHADDEMCVDAIKHYRAVIDEPSNVGIIHADCYFTQEGVSNANTPVARGTYGLFKAGKEAMSCPYGACSSVMVRNEAYTQLGTFIESMSTDVEMWARIASRYDVYSLDVPTVFYHVSSASTGPQSLVNRSVAEIKADWDNLNNHILSSFHSDTEREAYRAHLYTTGPDNYWPVITANIRARNWRNVLAAGSVIIIEYRGTLPLIRRIISSGTRMLRSLL